MSWPLRPAVQSFSRPPRHLDHFEDVESRQRRRLIHYTYASIAVVIALMFPHRLIIPDVFWAAEMVSIGFIIPMLLLTVVLAHRGHKAGAEMALLIAFCAMPNFAFWVIGSSKSDPRVVATYAMCICSLMFIWCNATFGIRLWKAAVCYLLISVSAIVMLVRMPGLSWQSVLCLALLIVTTAVMAVLSNAFTQRDERVFVSGGQRLLSAIVAGRHNLWAWDIRTSRCETLETNLPGPPRTLASDSADVLSRVHPDDRQYLRNFLRDCLARGESAAPAQYRLAPDAHGECLWYEGIAKVVEYDRRGRPTTVFGLAKNISDHKYLTRQLEEQSKELVRTMRAKSDFLATMSHEIRTPLNGILGMAALLQDQTLTAPQRQMVSIIHNSGTILLHILNDVLDFSKIEAGKLSVKPAPFNIKDLVERSMHSIEPSAQAKSLRTAITLAPEVSPWLFGDASLLSKVLAHLLSNAVKFTVTGGINLDVSVRSRNAAGVETLRFEVRDTGIGMDQEAQKIIYSPFTQVHGRGLSAEPGTGLGLAISKTMVEAMKGSIACSSELGRGTCITVELSFPACDAPSNTPKGSGRTGPARILVAEDNPVNQAVLKGLLRRLEHEVTVVSNGQEALDAVRNGSYDIVLMDCEMPVLDGLEATRRIRKIPGNENLPIIALSAHNREDMDSLCSAAGMSAYLMKPVDAQMLRAILFRWL